MRDVVQEKHGIEEGDVYQTERYNFKLVLSEAGSFVTRQGIRVELVCTEEARSSQWTVTQADLPRRPSISEVLTCRQQRILAACKHFKIVWRPLTGSVNNPFILSFNKLSWSPVGSVDDPRSHLVATAQAQGQNARFRIEACCVGFLKTKDGGDTIDTVKIDGRQYVITILPFRKNNAAGVRKEETLTPDFSLAERQRIEKISQLIDKFMSDMGFVIPVRGFLYQKLTVIEDAFNQIYLQHQRLEDLDNSLDDEELRDCEERVAELEAKIDSLKLKEE